ncbi:Uncharacterized protein GBIM_08203 [Gryllus bimaculatus]|nr:Uncharacterized protein GBIM_08203 [Gryllus bimaculatus]
MLTAKVLELRRGLATLCTAAAAENGSAEPHDDAEQNDEPSATFVVRPSAANPPPAPGGQAATAPQGQGDVSPVSVTVVPAFWRRPSAAAAPCSSASASAPSSAGAAASSPDPTARHSYSSAVSSTASEDEDEDEEDEEETEGRDDSDASERAPSAPAARRLPGPQLSRSQDDSDDSDDNKTDYRDSK